MKKLQRIAEVVAQVYEAKVLELRGMYKKGNIVEVRQAFIYEAHTRGYSNSGLGIFLNRHRTTILYHLQEGMDLVEYDKNFRKNLFKIRMVLDNDLELLIDELPQMDESDLSRHHQIELAVQILGKTGLSKVKILF